MNAPPVSISESMNLCLLVEEPIVAWHSDMVGGGSIGRDESQARLVRILQDYSTRLTTRLAAGEDASTKPSWLAKLLAGRGGESQEPECPAGIYVHGGVGTGKSMLMDAFFLQTPVSRKVRVHFHAFMKRLHAEMREIGEGDDPLEKIAGKLAERYRLICFDEFHVSDIADAMILGRLLDLLLGLGVHFVMTSNYAPDELYPNGLARDRFLPAIDLIRGRFDVHLLQAEQDYRLRQLSKGKTYHHPLGDRSEAELRKIFDRLANGISVKPSVKVNGRRIAAVARTTGAAWFTFAEMCASPRSQSDYLELADRFSTIIVSGVPEMASVGRDVSRRFTLLIDVLYDMRAKFVCSAAAPLEDLYGEGEGGESGRTLSRLQEMQSREYWSMPLAGHGSLL